MDAIVRRDASTLLVTTHNQYTSSPLTPSSVDPSPLAQFNDWFAAAANPTSPVLEPEAMTLATATSSGIPSSRIVLLKQTDARGFIFFTNYTSRKSRELTENPHAALTFYWREISRQVRVVGRAEKVERAESEAYFKSRPLGSRIGAWASKQSTVVGEGDLAARVAKMEERFGVRDKEEGEVDVPLPEFWGGWRIIPDEVEFWAGKPSRLHDRVRYLRIDGAASDAPQWKMERLSP